MDKMKMMLCDEGAVLGRAAHWLARVWRSTLVVVDVRDVDELAVFCWCCTLWRGVLAGAVSGLIAGLLIGGAL